MQRTRGEKSRVAAALKCQPAYLSQVLHKSAHLSLEQGELLGIHLKLNESEIDFLLLLIELERAGTPSLKKRLNQKRLKIILEREDLKNRLEFRKALSIEEQTEYYSSWIYAGVHLMVSIPTFQTKEGILLALKVHPELLTRALDFLIQNGLIQNVNGKYESGNVSLHLGNDSKLIRQHHTNWRLCSIKSLDHEEEFDLHYSSVISISTDDAPKVRKILMKAIEDVRITVKNSQSENTVFSYVVDLFELAKSP